MSAKKSASHPAAAVAVQATAAITAPDGSQSTGAATGRVTAVAAPASAAAGQSLSTQELSAGMSSVQAGPVRATPAEDSNHGPCAGKLWLSVGEVARRSGVSVATLHFYEQKKLISSQRNSGNQRRYSRDVLRRVAIIKVAQKTGISLEQIGQALAILPAGQQADPQHWQAMSARWQADLTARIEQLTQLRDQLTLCIGCGCLSLQHCPLRNPDDQLAALGAGAHFYQAAE